MESVLKKLHNKIISLTFASIFANSAFASPIITYTDGNGFNTGSLTESVTTGSLMHGMIVTTCFVSGSCESSNWNGLAGGYGEAGTSNWLLSINGNTFTNPFTFSTLNSTAEVMSISLNGRAGKTVFDVNYDDMLSVGSFYGRPFELSGANPDIANLTVNVNYTDRLAVDDVFYGDLFTVMSIDFGGSAFNGSFKFITDTDNTAFSEAIVPFDPIKVPLPGTVFLFAVGLASICFRNKLKNS